jgi:hypothetical protein
VLADGGKVLVKWFFTIRLLMMNSIHHFATGETA